MNKKLILSFYLATNFLFANTLQNNFQNSLEIKKIKKEFTKKELNLLNKLLFINGLKNLSYFNITPIKKLQDFRLLKFKQILVITIGSAYQREIELDKLSGIFGNKKVPGLEEIENEPQTDEVLWGLPEMTNNIKILAKIILLSQIDWGNNNKKLVNTEFTLAKNIYKKFEKRINYELSIVYKIFKDRNFALRILKNSGLVNKNNKFNLDYYYNIFEPRYVNSSNGIFNSYIYFSVIENEHGKEVFYPGNFIEGDQLMRKVMYMSIKNNKKPLFVLNNYKIEDKLGNYILIKSLPLLLIDGLYKSFFVAYKKEYQNFLINILTDNIYLYNLNAGKKLYYRFYKDFRVYERKKEEKELDINKAIMLIYLYKHKDKVFKIIKYNMINKNYIKNKLIKILLK